VEIAGPLLVRTLIVGGGAIGFLAAWLARHTGAAVTVVDISDDRRSQLESLGFVTSPAVESEVDVDVDSVGLEILGGKRSLTSFPEGRESLVLERRSVLRLGLRREKTLTRVSPSRQSKRADLGFKAVRSQSSPWGSHRSRSDSSTNASYSRSTGTLHYW